MTALHHKLYRELWAMKEQALAIALVLACGVGTYIMSLSTLESLHTTRAALYEDYSFGDMFVSLKRAPDPVRERIESISGIGRVETRVVAHVNLDVEGYSDPATARLVSWHNDLDSALNRIYLKEGRTPDPSQDDEVVASEAFAEAHGMGPGDRLTAIINGRRKELRIVGTGISPDYIYQIAPGAMMPDFDGYAILWMPHKPLATAYDMDGAFNDVVMTLTAAAEPQVVIAELDRLLARYGGLGAYERKDQLSHRYLDEEFRQLEAMSTIFPAVFLGVAAFLLNVVFSRQIQLQREEIATLKAFGYSQREVAWHYAQFAAIITGGGIIIGILLGRWLGVGLSEMYMGLYRFPFLLYRLSPEVAVEGATISVGAALVGAVHAVRRAAVHPPAEAMRAEPPASYRETIVERLGLKRFLSGQTRMILRNIGRRPMKSMLTALGIALAYATLMMAFFFYDCMDYLMDVEFRLARRDTLSVAFVEPTSYRALYELKSLPGVEYVEGYRVVPVRFRFGHRTYRTKIEGVMPDGDLRKLLNVKLGHVQPPPEGMVMTDYLAELLGVSPGEYVTAEILEGNRPVRSVPLIGVVKEHLGVTGYMRMENVNRLLREGSAISGAYLAVDGNYLQDVYDELKETPRVAATTVRRRAEQSLRDTMADMLLTYAGISTALAATIAFGVIYNSARISLSERSRELASMRVLGFTRGEISYILLGEIALLTVAALGAGVVVGRIFCAYFIQAFQTDLFRIPFVLELRTYSFCAIVVLGCSLVSGLVVRRRIDRLDLVKVLKRRE